MEVMHAQIIRRFKVKIVQTVNKLSEVDSMARNMAALHIACCIYRYVNMDAFVDFYLKLKLFVQYNFYKLS